MNEIINERTNPDDGDRITAHLPLRVYIGNVHDERIGGFTIPLPTTPETLQPFLDGVEITGWQDMEIIEVTADNGDVGDLLTGAVKRTMSPDALDELNYLAAKLSEMPPVEYEFLAAITQSGRHCSSVAEIINAAENIRCFDLQPAYTAAQYGEFLVNMAKDSLYGVFDRLSKSEHPDDREFAEYIQRLEEHVNYTAYGNAAAARENGVFTEYGYLTEDEAEFKSIYRTSQDIPDEYRIFTNPDEIIRPPLKLDGVDIGATIVKLHAICTDRMSNTAENLKVLMGTGARNYLLMINRERVSVFPALDAYKSGDIAEKAVAHGSHMPGTTFFAVRVTERGETITGDFIELNTEALRTNISRHSVEPNRIEAVKHDGFSKSYDLEAWNNVTESQRGELKEYRQHFDENRLEDTARRWQSLVGAHEQVSNTVGLDVFLPDVAAAYTHVNMCYGMLRVADDAAKEILARGDADVYRLVLPEPVKLAQIEAMRPITQHNGLAIKREDVECLDKWARRKADDIMRKTERGERDKSKSCEDR
ncbi:MAG: antirestriction protein ArdA [Oscillospiraceae bacterium]|nr:antirestriction protein ArdA [Oscillospiraceae bacterium]